MGTIAAREAKLRFGELLDTAQREPVTIKKHGRRVAVVLSATEYDALVEMKRDRILAEIQVGLDQLDRGEGVAYDEASLDAFADRVKRGGGWDSTAFLARSAYRDHLEPNVRTQSTGCRPARPLREE